MKIPHPITTGNLSNIELQNFNDGDNITSYLSWLNNSDVNNHLEIRHNPPASESELLKFIEDEALSTDSMLLKIMMAGSHVGNVRASEMNYQNRRFQIGIIIGEISAWNKGVATEVIKATVSYLFENLDFHKAYATIYQNNVGSLRAFEKAGFRLSGVHKDHWLIDGKYIDDLIYYRVKK